MKVVGKVKDVDVPLSQTGKGKYDAFYSAARKLPNGYWLEVKGQTAEELRRLQSSASNSGFRVKIRRANLAAYIRPKDKKHA